MGMVEIKRNWYDTSMQKTFPGITLAMGLLALVTLSKLCSSLLSFLFYFQRLKKKIYIYIYIYLFLDICFKFIKSNKVYFKLINIIDRLKSSNFVVVSSDIRLSILIKSKLSE